MKETAKKAFYAAIGAPVVAVRRVSDGAEKLAERVSSDARAGYDVWAEEGERIVTAIGERQDLEQLQGQVTKLREQLEETVEAWRDSFRPADTKESVEVQEAPSPGEPEPTEDGAKKAAPAEEEATEKPSATKAAKKGPATKPSATKASAKKGPAKKGTGKKKSESD